MTHIDLFSLDDRTQDDGFQDWYRERLKESVAAANRYCMDQDILPPWQDHDIILSKDEFKILNAIMDTAGHLYLGGKDDDLLRESMGYKSKGNLEATLNKLVNRNLVVAVVDVSYDESGRSDRMRFSMTEYGRWLFEKVELDGEWDDTPE